MELPLLTYGDTWDGHIISRPTAERIRYQSFGKRVYRDNKWWTITNVHMRDNEKDTSQGVLVAEMVEA